MGGGLARHAARPDVPLPLGPLGGIIACVVVRHDGPRLAGNCPVIGMAVTVLSWVVPTLPVVALPGLAQ